jgi:hypothetical protein
MMLRDLIDQLQAAAEKHGDSLEVKIAGDDFDGVRSHSTCEFVGTIMVSKLDSAKAEFVLLGTFKDTKAWGH